jgi:NADH-quinone oxidoreductase subunit H
VRLRVPYGIFFDENGFYLFAEYANMFISSNYFSGTVPGAYNYPGMAWAVENWGVNIANIIYSSFVCKIMFFHLFLHVGAMDYSKIQIRSIDAFRMESLIPLSIINIIINWCYLLRFKLIWDFNTKEKELIKLI